MKYSLHLTFSIISLAIGLLCAAQVTKLSNNSNFLYSANLNGKVVLVSKADSLWSSDGTAAGTIKYAANVSVEASDEIGFFSGKLYFTGVDDAGGAELWVTDGTAAGTHIVKDIVPGTNGSSPTGFTEFNGALYFFATTTAAGKELWKTNGTDGGTVLVKDINPGAAGSYTPSTYLFLGNGILFFTADDGTSGNELWKTDGTEAGTALIKDIYTGTKSSDCNGFTVLGTLVIFSATDKNSGTELWKTDGTSTGTVLVKDILPGAGPLSSSSPAQFLAFNGKLYFVITDILQGGQSMWTTDGTTAGTTLIKAGLFAILSNAVFINNKFYFLAITNANGGELWNSDGTATGTALFKDIKTGGGSSNPFILLDYFDAGAGGNVHSILYNGKMFFTADNGTSGTELWFTDGTDAGTAIVKDINPGVAGVNLSSYYYTNQGLFFGADDGTTGNEVWKSDGTLAGTARVTDINPGTGSADPQFLLIFNSHLLLNADDGDNTDAITDLYSLDQTLGTLPITLLDFTAAVYGKSVQLKWATSSETNSKNFEIQRSKDGVQFESIGSVNAAGSSSINTAYTFTDADALHLQTEKLFYRLKMIDKDNQFAWSKIAIVNIVPDTRLFYTYPNPVKDQLQVTVNSQDQKQAAIRITDQTGKLVYSRQLGNAQGSYRYNVNVSSFAKGLYVIQLITSKGTETTRFIKE